MNSWAIFFNGRGKIKITALSLATRNSSIGCCCILKKAMTSALHGNARCKRQHELAILKIIPEVIFHGLIKLGMVHALIIFVHQ